MEFPDLGKHCGMEGCGQLDFLPAACVHCAGVFCSDHLSPFVHPCEAFKSVVLTDKDLEERERVKWQVKCSHPNCKVKDLLPLRCSRCGGHFCLSHRHADQHDCPDALKDTQERLESHKKATEVSKSGQELQNKVKEEIQTRLEEAKSAGGHKGAMATKLALMKLKGRAKGDNAVPQTERIFFSVDCPNKEQNPKPLDVWMSKVWTMGKAIDFMARQARIKNRNNITDAPKLHIFKDEVCLSVPPDSTVNSLLSDGIIVDGDALILKLVPAEEVASMTTIGGS